MTSQVAARDKAARLLKRRGSASSLASSEYRQSSRKHHHGSMSTVSFMDEPGHDDNIKVPVKLENTFQTEPGQNFPSGKVRTIIRDVLEGYLQAEKYEPELCRQMTKTLSEVVKARVKELMIPRFKIICLIHIGQLNSQGMRIGSRCLWNSNSDTYSTYEFRNESLFAVGSVYAVYFE